MKERIDRNIVSPTEQPVLPQSMIHTPLMIEGKEYTIAGHSYPPFDKTDTHVLLIREPDRLVEHDRFVRKSDII